MKTTFKQYLKTRNNAHMNRAKTVKNDEFYTVYKDAERMIRPFGRRLVGKSVLCNCDDPDKSDTYKYLKNNFVNFGIAKLVGVGLGSDMEVVDSMGNVKRVHVKNGGDFRKGESLAALKDCDVVVSNPPFSRDLGHDTNKFVEFAKLALDNGKDLLAVGPLDGAKYVGIGSHIVDGSLHCIKSSHTYFSTKQGERKNVKVAVYTTFPDDPFSGKLVFDKASSYSALPVDARYKVPVSIYAPKGSFSVMHIPDVPSGKRIILPLEILRKRWYDEFRIVKMLNSVDVGGKIRMSGILMERI